MTWLFKNLGNAQRGVLGECHCWWTSESPRAHVAKFYGWLRLIRSVWRAPKFCVFKINWNCNYVGLLHHPFWLQLVLALFGHYFLTFYTTYIAKDQWRGFSTRNAHMVHIVNSIRLKWCIYLIKSVYLNLKCSFHKFNICICILTRIPLETSNHE